MFKVICELDRFEVLGLIGLRYKNCRPCEFSDYQMSEGTSDSALRAVKAYHVAKKLEVMALEISTPEYKSLANKLEYVRDLSDYRHISLYDESDTITNVIKVFDNPWIYSAIIKLHIPSALDKILIASQSFLSWFDSKPATDINKNKPEEFYTLWQKSYLFHIPETEFHDRLLGTIQKSDFNDGSNKQYYGIDKYFLTYLLAGKENSKCIPLHADQLGNALIYKDEQVIIQQEDIYEDYKASLPKLFGLEFLEKLSRLRSCISNNNEGTILIIDEGDKFTLKPKNYKAHPITEIKLCEGLNGMLASVSIAVKNAQAACKERIESSYPESDDQMHTARNDLYTFDCHTMKEALTAVGNFSDIYPY
ncbi:hypothetical protein [endosymbiont of Acanthamoeba sp. UWC8]|uniref:hypothetical protein n=1 Tax=endosymbiont of Acanthamoeba sp. UWC8 TaxID=86106 RepID=UPI0011DDCCE5|nr:hypothetical protein [endosymbiont of Acanthamoeba sp. UWC8]